MCTTHNNVGLFRFGGRLETGGPEFNLLFLFFVNDIRENINANLDGVITVNEIKLFLIMFADDTALFATNPKSLQLMLNDLETYCDRYSLKINANKTKAMIFEIGNRGSTYDFFLNNIKIEIVTSFKYLGVYFFKNNNWKRT